MTPPKRTYSETARSDDEAENTKSAPKRQDLAADDTVPQAAPDASQQSQDAEGGRVIKTEPGTASSGPEQSDATMHASVSNVAPTTGFVPLAGSVPPRQSSSRSTNTAS